MKLKTALLLLILATEVAWAYHYVRVILRKTAAVYNQYDYDQNLQ